MSPLWKAARVGERLSPYVSIACVVMAVSFFFFLSLLSLLVSFFAAWFWGGEGGVRVFKRESSND